MDVQVEWEQLALGGVVGARVEDACFQGWATGVALSEGRLGARLRGVDEAEVEEVEGREGFEQPELEETIYAVGEG